MAVHESHEPLDPLPAMRTYKSQVLQNPGAEAAAEEKQRIVPGHDTDERHGQRCGILRNSTMDQETAGQQCKIFGHG
jgi:hypothetical protein